jgi:hypothetical protein
MGQVVLIKICGNIWLHIFFNGQQYVMPDPMDVKYMIFFEWPTLSTPVILFDE